MRKVRFDNMLRKLPGPVTRRAGFSLAELVVSVGVLVVMLAIAGEVMRLTVSATGQARGLTEINQQLRIFEQLLREDLRLVSRDASVMAIQGNPINAYWTQDGKDVEATGNPQSPYPHSSDPERSDPLDPTKLDRPRADILMFFTGRSGSSAVHNGVTGGLQQVVYGHADLGDYGPGGTFTTHWAYPENADDPHLLPAEFWHLARRNVLISGNQPAAYLLTPPPTALEDPRILRGETDVIENYNYEQSVLVPGKIGDTAFVAGNFPTYLPLVFRDPADANGFARPFARSQLDETPPVTMPHGVNHHFLPKCASFKVEWALDPRSDFVGGLLDGEPEVYWFDPGVLAIPPAANPAPLTPLVDAEAAATNTRKERLFRVRTHLRGGHRTLTQTELYSLENRFNGPTGGATWHDAVPENTVVFTSTRLDPNDQMVPEDVFPGALRITIDVYDPQRRLERPIRHVIVVPVGV